ncbi:Trafficking protein particle complex subunit 12 [Rhynchospora pubera]|uniref:Trafficking protein particle complex subunit 12 n=1 Tax=Rhynchospora pubera TaxID=906938 RepID=A0AAV8FHZ6_9POAL|nr:Trafficking protein particle complex subunit 12 [Rhynchospora pubera]
MDPAVSPTDPSPQPDPLSSPLHTTSSQSPISFASPDDISPSLSSLLSLCHRGQWNLLLSSLPSSSPLSHPPHLHLLHSTLSALSLFKLRRYPDLSRLLSTLSPLDSPQYHFQSYPSTYPHLSGSFVPFSLRILHALLPHRLGDRPQTLDRLYDLLCLCRTHHWPHRESHVLSLLFAHHFSYKEYDVALSLIQEMLEEDPSDPVALSRLGYLQLQIGDLNGANSSFQRVESVIKEAGLDTDASKGNLIGRNKALGFVVAKDYTSAVREYETCIERDSADVVAVNNKAVCLMYSRDLSDAVKGLETALERIPTVAVDETVVVNLCSMYELAFVNHAEVKKTLATWIQQVAPDDFDPSCTRI